jgi:hypothetical protein
MGIMKVARKVISKTMGVDGQIDAANRNAAAQEEAVRSSAAAQQQALAATAQAAADQQSQQTARMAAEEAASEAQSKPLGTAEVQLDAPSTESASSSRRQRRAQFGRGYSSGVSI